VESDVSYSTGTKKIIRVQEAVVRDVEDFQLDPSLYSFQWLDVDRVVGSKNGKELTAQAGDYIIFPRPKAKFGAEAYLIGREL
jgi:succinylglutamate desuccinylase